MTPESRGQGLAYDLISRSLELAECLGFKMCSVRATSDFSKKAFLKAGFVEVIEYKYSEWTFNDNKVFGGISDHQGITFMAKIL